MLKRRLISLSGCVQGVGFRPFVYRMAHQYRLAGSVKNTNTGVMIDVQGEEKDIVDFQNALITGKPKQAVISEIKMSEAIVHFAKDFEIVTSDSREDAALPLLPDTAVCSSCLEELYDPSNRRYQYPFLHCVNCGPRFSLLLRTPFDRNNTTMENFCMCEECQSEYRDPEDRRFYSQTNCCPACGPKLQLLDGQGSWMASGQDAWVAIVDFLQQGRIAAVKNTGGYLLLADATQNQAIERLRLLKRRARKPFALLANLTLARRVAEIDSSAENLLISPAAPIVFLKKLLNSNLIAPAVSPASPYHGIMLPHNALQHLLIDALNKPLAATSGNVSGQPLCITEEEAFSRLKGIADIFLIHNRQIVHRLDDSVVHLIAGRPMMIRRARGYIPTAIEIPEPLKHSSHSIFAAGGHLKNSFAIAQKHRIYLSQHIGDLDTIETCGAFDETVEKWKNLLSVKSFSGIGDMHPAYYTSSYLEERRIEHDEIQHHVAHGLAAMADNQIQFPFLGIVWDGTGMGEDNTIWGGEAFIFEKEKIQRFATLYPFALPGGEKAIREPRRSALGGLYAIFGDRFPPSFERWLKTVFTMEELNVLLRMLARKINSPLCSSMGRLFDATSALLDCCLVSDFEGQAAIALEATAKKTGDQSIEYSIPLISDEKGILLLDWRPMFKQMFEDKESGCPSADISLAFHEALAQCIVDLAKAAELPKVLLTGGCMQNKLLTEKTIVKLKTASFNAYWHHRIPPNDGGLAAGQIIGKLIVENKKNVPRSAR